MRILITGHLKLSKWLIKMSLNNLPYTEKIEQPIKLYPMGIIHGLLNPFFNTASIKIILLIYILKTSNYLEFIKHLQKLQVKLVNLFKELNNIFPNLIISLNL